jgi:hypothetical protein
VSEKIVLGWAFRSSSIFFKAATFEFTKRRGRPLVPGALPVPFETGTSGASAESARDGNRVAGAAPSSCDSFSRKHE